MGQLANRSAGYFRGWGDLTFTGDIATEEQKEHLGGCMRTPQTPAVNHVSYE